MPVCWAEVHLLSGYVLSCHNWRELSARSHKILQMTKIFLHLMLTHPFAKPQRSLFPSLLQDLHPNLFMHWLGCFFIFVLTLCSEEQLWVMFIAGSVSFCSSVVQAGKPTNKLCSPDPLFPTLLNTFPTSLTEWHALSCGLSSQSVSC